MKIGSDAVLMGSLLNVDTSKISALEIGTGTGVISLMLAQRFNHLKIKALEIDIDSAEQAALNFNNSPFSNRITIEHTDFLKLECNEKFDLIFSNPPYFYHSLKNDNQQKSIARHISWDLFSEWLDKMHELSHSHTEITLILPVDAFDKTNEYLSNKGLHLINDCHIKSFDDTEVIRKLSTWCYNPAELNESEFIIYATEKVHSDQYINALRDYLIIF